MREEHFTIEQRLNAVEDHCKHAPDREEMDRVSGRVELLVELLVRLKVITNEEDIIRIAEYDPSPGIAIPETDESGPLPQQEEPGIAFHFSGNLPNKGIAKSDHD